MGRKRAEPKVEIVKPADNKNQTARRTVLLFGEKRPPLLSDGYVTHRLGVYHG